MANPARLPWWEADDSLQKFQRSIAEAQEQLRSMPRAAMAEVEARAFVLTVLVSCEAERVPAHILHAEDAFRILAKLYNEILHFYPAHLAPEQFDRRFLFQCEHDWPWQHYLSNSQRAKAACLSQMKQHLKALMFLCIYNKDKSLNAPLLKSTHAILMKGYILCEDSRIHNGCFRDYTLFSDGSAFIHEGTIASSVKDMLRRLHGEDEPPVRGVPHQHRLLKFPERCATLVHDMTHIQPFPYGNEWMCRLIMAFFMVACDGFAFPVPIAPITDRSYQEFLHALPAPGHDQLQLQEDSAAGFRREKALLSAYILECVWESLEEVMCSNQDATQDYY